MKPKTQALLAVGTIVGTLLAPASVMATAVDADLSIVKSVSDSTPEYGDEVFFTLTANNPSQYDAYDVVVTDTLPVGFTAFAFDTSIGNCVSNVCTFDFGTLFAGSNVITVLSTIVNAYGTFTNTATIASASIIDPDPNNNSDSVRFAVAGSPPPPVPEPGTLALLGLGLAGLGLSRRRKTH